MVIGEAENGAKALSPILTMLPDVVLIDLLMPELNGIETIERLKLDGFQGKFIMISQVANKNTVGEAYEKGIEFFIHKPINRIEVQSVLEKTEEKLRLKNSLQTIRESLNNIGLDKDKTVLKRSVRETVLSILNDIGIIGETGSDDIIGIMEFLMNENERITPLPSLKDLYAAAASRNGYHYSDIKKESKAIEQRIRRTILTAVNNLAALGAIDYTNPEFEYYAPRYFDFQEISDRMRALQEGRNGEIKAKVNIRKFLQVLYFDTMKKLNENYLNL
jgi:two-component system response regulator YcbB